MSKRSLSGDVSATKRTSIIPVSINTVNDTGVSECFHKITTKMFVSLAPIHLNNPINGIKAQHLDPLVMNYFSKAKGVVLAYSNIRLSADNISVDSNERDISVAKIEGSSPFTFLWITIDLLIWRPQVGDVLEGFIYMQTASHLGLLIHDTFNASIKKYNIPTGWSFVPSQEDELIQDYEAEESADAGAFKSFGYWVDENKAKVEGKLKFTIKAIYSAGRVVSVEGTLIKPGAERDAQPVFRERRTSSSGDLANPGLAGSPKGKHMKFGDEDIDSVTEIPEPTETEIPVVSAESEEEEGAAVVNTSDSDDEDSE